MSIGLISVGKWIALATWQYVQLAAVLCLWSPSAGWRALRCALWGLFGIVLFTVFVAWGEMGGIASIECAVSLPATWGPSWITQSLPWQETFRWQKTFSLAAIFTWELALMVFIALVLLAYSIRTGR